MFFTKVDSIVIAIVDGKIYCLVYYLGSNVLFLKQEITNTDLAGLAVVCSTNILLVSINRLQRYKNHMTVLYSWLVMQGKRF